MSYRKVGGLHFFRIWRFGFTWYWAKPKPDTWPKRYHTYGAMVPIVEDHYDRHF